MTGLFLILGSATQASAICEDVIYRIWQKGNEDRHYAFGEEVALEIGQEAHLYLHYRSQSKNPFSTTAEIGYPSSFGLRGDKPRDIGNLLALKAQSDKDRSEGRLIMNAKTAGATSLGYRILGVTPPGKLDQVPQACRTGTVRLKVAGNQTTKPPENAVTTPREAADRLVVLLYQGLMRRQTVRGYPEGQVDMVLNGGHQGAIELAVEMVGSAEFRDEVRRRTIDAHAALDASSSDRLISEQLLGDIYRSLYGAPSIAAQEHARNIEDLALCLRSGGVRGRAACERLARGLVGYELFSSQHAALLSILSIDERRGLTVGEDRGREVERNE